MVHISTERFKEESRRTIADPQLQEALRRSMTNLDGGRRTAIAEFTPERWQEFRQKAKAIKTHTVKHLDYYLERFVANVERDGGIVHYARTAEEGNRIILDLVKAKDVRTVVKGKSMVSEEMGVRQALEQMGVEVVETDLGEYIIQLANEPPFHIVGPALHKTKEDVAALFERHGVSHGRLQRIEDMTRAAREKLREVFLRADMGMTGVNFGVAETGTMMIVTNEGNGRMCSSAPRIHVATMGVEKLVPSLEDLAVFLRLLPRAATGQRISVYMSFFNGARRQDDEDGPEEFHLVLVDNGRSRLLADEDLREAANCIRCGACLNVCPVYRRAGGHAYGFVYPGPIGSIWSPVLVGLPDAKDLPFASSLCGACHEACPVDINIPRMLLRLRNRLAEGEKGDRSRAAAEAVSATLFSTLMGSPGRLGAARAVARIAQAPFVDEGRVPSVPVPPFSAWTGYHDLPPMPSRSFHQLWQDGLKDEGVGTPNTDKAAKRERGGHG